MTQFLIDNILLLAIILVCVVTLSAPYIASKRYGPEVDSSSATDIINHKNAQIVDLRDPKDFKKECIARSINIPADRIHHEFAERLDKTRPVLLVDEDGRRARMASPLLRGVGFKEVYILQGGLRAWRRASMPFTR
ncbi:MAG: rhodanese-like domain-containing protein [Duodenibacillus sp.]